MSGGASDGGTARARSRHELGILASFAWPVFLYNAVEGS